MFSKTSRDTVNIRESYRLQVKENEEKLIKSHRRSSVIFALACRNLNQQLQSLSLSKLSEYSPLFEQMTKTLHQCSQELEITEDNIKILIKTINSFDKGWEFLETFCSKISESTQRYMVKNKIFQLIAEVFHQNELNIPHSLSAIRILGHLYLFSNEIERLNVIPSIIEVAKKHQKHLFEPLCYFLSKISSVDNAPITLGLFSSNVGLFVHMLEQEYINLALYCRFLGNLMNCSDLGTIQQFIDHQFLQKCLNVIRKPQLIGTLQESTQLLKLIIKFYSVAIQQPKHIPHLQQMTNEILTWVISLSQENISCSTIRTQVFYFWSLISQDEGMFLILMRKDMFNKILTHLTYSVEKYNNFGDINEEEDCLFQILDFIQGYVAQLRTAEMRESFLESNLFYKLRQVAGNYHDYSQFIQIEVVRMFRVIGSECGCEELVQRIVDEASFSKSDHAMVRREMEINGFNARIQ